jgi:hypothetical protein
MEIGKIGRCWGKGPYVDKRRRVDIELVRKDIFFKLDNTFDYCYNGLSLSLKSINLDNCV